jgi:hypothetical protein
VRLAEPAVLALVQPGDRVDLLATASLAAPDALVLGVVAEDGAILLALRPTQARSVVALPPSTHFTVLVR